MGSEVLHVANCVGIPRMGEIPGVTGKSVIEYAREQMGEALVAQQFGAGFFAGGATPTLAIKHPKPIKQPEKFRERWEKVHGQSVRKIAVLDEGMDIKVLGMPLEDAQFLESRQFYVTEVARWFGVPPHKLRDLMRATFSNIAEQKLEWYEDLLPWLTLSEQEYNAKLFTRGERQLFTEHVVEGLLKGDIEKRYNAYSTLLQWGVANVNEVRRRENMNSIGPVGDVYMVPANMMNAERLMDEPENAWWDDTETEEVVKGRDDILVRSFNEGYASTMDKLGKNRNDWKWGELHTSTFVSNPLGVSGIRLIEGMVNRGPFSTGGSTETLNATRWAARSGNFEVDSLPSMRMIIDLGNLGQSLTVHTTGQSGHPYSKHYDDMIELWRNIEYYSMLWTREQIETAAVNRLVLNPAD